MLQDLNLAEGYLGRGPPDIVRSAMPNGFSSRHFYSGNDGAQMGRPFEDARTQRTEKQRDEAGGTWPRQVQGILYAKYLDGSPLEDSAPFPPPPVLQRSSASRLHSQPIDFPSWAESPPSWGDRRLDPDRVLVSAALPTVTIQDFSVAPLHGILQNAHHSSSGEHQSRSFTTALGAELPNNKDSVRSPVMNDRKYGTSGQSPFNAISHGASQSWNNMGNVGGSEMVHHTSRGVGTQTGTGEYYSRLTQQLMRVSENVTDDQLQRAKTQTLCSPEARTRNESNGSRKALLPFSLPGQSSSFAEEDSRNSENVGDASVNKTQTIWRNNNPVDQATLSGSEKFRGFNRIPLDGYLSEPCLAVKLADNASVEFCPDGTHLKSTARVASQPKSLYSHDRNLLYDRTFTHGDNFSRDRTFIQQRTFSHGDTYSHNQNFSRDLNTSYDHIFSHDRSFPHNDTISREGPFSDSKGSVSGNNTLSNGADEQQEEVLRRWRTPLGVMTTSEPVTDQDTGARLVKEMFSTEYDSRKRTNGVQEDLVSSGGFKETDCGKAMMDQHRKWIQMEERLLSRIYDLQKERRYLTARVEELAAENWNLAGKFKDAVEQSAKKELEMENVRRQLREKIVDMTATVCSSQVADSTPSTSHRDAISSNNRQRCHDDETDARRGRQMAQEELAACQIRFARERERWINEKIKVLRYQQLLQAKYEKVAAENRILKEQVERRFCPNATPVGSNITQKKLTLLKDEPSSRSYDSVG